MAKYYVAASIDGYIADADDGLDWLDNHPKMTVDTYTPFIEKVGAICMGSATYAFILRHVEAGNPWPYEVPCWVFTTQTWPVPDGATIHFVSGAVEDAYEAMQQVAGRKDVWVAGGGELAGQFLDAGLLEEIILTVASTTLGTGKPLLPRDAVFDLVSARELGPGYAELRYRPRPAAAADV